MYGELEAQASNAHSNNDHDDGEHGASGHSGSERDESDGNDDGFGTNEQEEDMLEGDSEAIFRNAMRARAERGLERLEYPQPTRTAPGGFLKRRTHTMWE